MERGLCSLPIGKIEAAATLLKVSSLSIQDCMVADYRARVESECSKQCREMIQNGGILPPKGW